MRIIVNLLTFLAMYFSCETNVDRSVESKPQYFPNRPGSRWIYDLIRIPFGSRDSTYVGELNITITSGETLITGQQASRWEIASPDSNINKLLFGSSVVYVHETDNEMTIYSALKDTSGTVIYRFPLTVGKKWRRGESFVSLVDSLENISVPAGTFSSCPRVRTTGGWWQAPVEQTEWVKEGIGIIQGRYSQVGLLNEKFALKLKTYHIVGKR